ncbi:MAG TPA: energy transducer TonB [Rhizomicrobium sp.]|nr:energy transducer TonB [Rhizomicrobium sp.]
MIYRNVAPVLRSFGFAGFVCCAAMLGPEAAQAADTPAHVDSSKPNADPIYPDSARAAGEQGTILIDVLIRSDGRLSKFRVAQSSGYGDLDDAAVQSVLNWHFAPATRDGDPVTDWTTVKVEYRLPQSAAATPPPQAQ